MIKSSVILTRGREHSLKKKHHWIFSGAIARIEGEASEGDLVWIKDHKGKTLGYGFYGTKSIAVRILSFDPKIDPTDQVLEYLKSARKKRKKLGLIPSEVTDSFRFFHSEGDMIPGLTIDKYSTIIVIQIHHDGIVQFLPVIQEYLTQKFPETDSIILKTGRSSENKDNFKYLLGDKSTITIKENDIRFEIDVLNGQKTGFFLDQRDNREILGNYSEDKTVLNLFCYTGAFSAYALKNSAKKVTSVDSSENAIEAAKKNMQLSSFPESRYEFIHADCEKFLTENEENFDIVICDPPALVKSKRDLHKGLKHYLDLNKLALKHLKKDGLLFTFSCSQFVRDKDLHDTVLKAAKSLDLELTVVETLKQAGCHTINQKHPESIYLKGYIFKLV